MSISTDTLPGYVAGTWALDAAHSEITFFVRHLAISKVRGSFKKFDATVVTAENPADSTFTATVEVASIDTNNADRDAHLRTNDFFNAEEFPTIEFVSTGLDHDGEDLVLTGNITIRGVTKPITIKAEFNGIITDPYGQVKAGASAEFKINRQDFGVKYNSVTETGGLLLGDEITVHVEGQVVLQK